MVSDQARLASSSGDFCVGTRLSFADAVLAEALTSYLEVVSKSPFRDVAAKGLQSRVLEQESITSNLGFEQNFPKADDGVVTAAARVLQGALPLHMPDADGFVVKA